LATTGAGRWRETVMRGNPDYDPAARRDDQPNHDVRGVTIQRFDRVCYCRNGVLTLA
jgi:hypothetical protein